MYSNILFSIRRSAKSPLFAIISVAGLALGIACAYLIGLFVAFETDYETIAPDRDNIYRVFGPTRARALPSPLSLTRSHPSCLRCPAR